MGQFVIPKPQVPPHHIRIEAVELAAIEEHLLACPRCVECAEESAGYVDAIRAGIIVGNFELE